MKKRSIIAIEGCDGSGKTTTAHQLVDWLLENNIRAQYYQHPGHGDVGQQIRSIFKEGSVTISSQVLLILSNQMETIKSIVEDDVDVAIVDRWVLSTVIYQSTMLLDQLDCDVSQHHEFFRLYSDLIVKMEEIAQYFLKHDVDIHKQPHRYYTFIAHAPWDIITDRLNSKHNDWIESLPNKYMQRIHSVFKPKDNNEPTLMVRDIIHQTSGKFLGYLDTSKPLDTMMIEEILSEHGIIKH